jgi:hypothetical protein
MIIRQRFEMLEDTFSCTCTRQQILMLERREIDFGRDFDRNLYRAYFIERTPNFRLTSTPEWLDQNETT